MTARGTAAALACGLTIAAAHPSSAMPISGLATGQEVQRVNLNLSSPRTLLIRRDALLAVEPRWAEGWGVPIVGSVRILPAALARW